MPKVASQALFQPPVTVCTTALEAPPCAWPSHTGTLRASCGRCLFFFLQHATAAHRDPPVEVGEGGAATGGQQPWRTREISLEASITTSLHHRQTKGTFLHDFHLVTNKPLSSARHRTQTVTWVQSFAKDQVSYDTDCLGPEPQLQRAALRHQTPMITADPCVARVLLSPTWTLSPSPHMGVPALPLVGWDTSLHPAFPIPRASPRRAYSAWCWIAGHVG
mmetsp:Transcript_30788/g.49704  ORF Transcript_30788/g.49704 Transcript_30788/m.49704 type:complete len:220 (-) Transcript_30788:300-959(-)